LRLSVARTLGYAPVAAWLKTVAPALYPLIRLPLMAVVAYSSSVVDVAIILGPTNPPPLSAALLRWLNDPDLGARFMASAGALLQVGVTAAALLIVWLAERLAAVLAARWLENGRRQSLDAFLKALGGLGMAMVAATAVLGFACLLIWSFAAAWRFPDLWPHVLTLDAWTRSAAALTAPLEATFGIGLVSTAISLAIVLAALEHERWTGRPAGRWAIGLLYLPLLVPPVAFLFGLVVASSSVGIAPGAAPVIVGHIVFVLPYIYLSLSEPYRKLDPRWSRTAATLGAGPVRTFLEVRLPLLLAPCLTAAAVGFSVSVGQYLATQLLGAGRVATLTTEAVALSSGGERRVIAVWALAQMLLPAVAFAMAIGIPQLLWHKRRAMLDLR
jgi:putative thiamine transport system permease protein